MGLKKITNWIGEKVTEPIKKAADKYIGQPLTQGVRQVKQAVGLEATPIPDEAKAKLDPRKTQALSEYGEIARKNAQNAQDPGAYQPGRYNPRQAQNAQLPGTKFSTPAAAAQQNNIFIPREAGQGSTRTFSAGDPQNRWNERGTAPQQTNMGSLRPAQIQEYSQQLALRRAGNQQLPTATSEGAMQAPQLQNEQGVVPGSTHSYLYNPQARFERFDGKIGLEREGGQPGVQYQREGQQPGPEMTREGSQQKQQSQSESGQQLTLEREAGNVMKLGRQGGDIQLGREGSVGLQDDQFRGAIQQAIQEQMGPLSLAQGYDPAMRQKAVSLATSGIELQKQRALEKLKEEQMSAGNFGSSVGQAKMAELAAEYDRQSQQAMLSIDLQGLEADREDRYRNQSAQQQRLGQLASMAGQGQNLALTSGQFQRQGIGADNNAAMSEAEFARRGTAADNAATMNEMQFDREGRAIDRSSTTTEAQFGREGRGIDENARRFDAGFDREGRQIDNQSAMQLAQYGLQTRGMDYDRDMQQAQFGREGRGLDNQASMQERQMQFDAQARNNEDARYREQFELDKLQRENSRMMDEAQFDRGGRQLNNQNAMQLAGYGREGRGIDYDRGMQQAQFGREGAALDNQTALQEAGFNRDTIGRQADNSRYLYETNRQNVAADNDMAMRLAEYDRQGRSADYGRVSNENDRQFNQQMQLENWERGGRQIDLDNQLRMGDRGWNQEMEASRFNREGEALQSDADWRAAQEAQRRAENEASIGNQADLYNLEQEGRANEVNYGRYRNSINDLANYASGSQLDPQSVLDADVWQQQEAARQARFGGAVDTGLKLYDLATGKPSVKGSDRGPTGTMKTIKGARR